MSLVSTTRYYILSASTPATPTTNPPSGWTTTEPTYTAGSTDDLYFVDLALFSDGSYSYSEVTLSSTYAAARDAKDTADTAQNTADEAKSLAFVASDTAPTSPDEGYRWLDTGVTPQQMRVWMGADAPTGRDGGTVTQTFVYHAPDATSWTPSQSGSGTASMTNVRPLNAPKESAYFTRSDGVVCKATFASPVHGGSINSSGVVTKTYGYARFNGSESWGIYNNSFYYIRGGSSNYGGTGNGTAGTAIFSHGGSLWTNSSPNCCFDSDVNLQGFKSTYTSISALKTYLKSEYDAGHPLEAAYLLKSSTTVSTTIEPNVLTIDNTKGQIVSDITIDLDSTATADTTVYVNGTAYTIAVGEPGVTITGIEKTTYEIYSSTNLTVSYDANGWEVVNDTSAIEKGVSNAQSTADTAKTTADEAKALAFVASDTAPTSPDEGYRWLDTGVTPQQMRVWRGLSTTPSGANMTTERSIDETVEAASGATATFDNTDGTITSDIAVTVTDDSLTTATVTVNGAANTVTLTNGTGSLTLDAAAQEYTITADAQIDVSYTCSGWETVNDTTATEDKLDDAYEAAVAARTGVERLDNYIEITTNGLNVKSESESGNYVNVNNDGVDIYVNHTKTSSFISNGLVLGNYILWHPEESGGLAFNLLNE